MTLATNIWFQTDAPLSEVYVWVENLVKGRVKKPIIQDWDHLAEETGYIDQFSLAMGQGCDTMYLSHRFQGPLLGEDEDADTFVADPAILRTPATWTMVRLDTTYGGRSVGGHNCSQLHWEIIKTFFNKMGEDNVFWTNEFHGTLSQGRRGIPLGGG